MTTTLESTTEYYKDLLLYQYINLPKARAVIGLLVNQALVDLLPMSVVDAFDIETAVGPQLDVLGEYIGFDRYVVGAVARSYFTADDYVTPITNGFGFTDYTKPNQNANATFYSYVNYNKTTALDDDEYRLLLKLKIIMNASNFSLYDIVELLNDTFGGQIVVADGSNMFLFYFVAAAIERIATIAYDEGLLPKPMGVGIGGMFSLTDPSKLWGYSSYIAESGATIGWSTYSAWADAEMLDYTDDLLA